LPASKSARIFFVPRAAEAAEHFDALRLANAVNLFKGFKMWKVSTVVAREPRPVCCHIDSFERSAQATSVLP